MWRRDGMVALMMIAYTFRILIVHTVKISPFPHGHLVPRERVAPQSEVIRAIVLEDSPCAVGGPPHALLASRPHSGMASAVFAKSNMT